MHYSFSAPVNLLLLWHSATQTGAPIGYCLLSYLLCTWSLQVLWYMKTESLTILSYLFYQGSISKPLLSQSTVSMNTITLFILSAAHMNFDIIRSWLYYITLYFLICIVYSLQPGHWWINTNSCFTSKCKPIPVTECFFSSWCRSGRMWMQLMQQ